MEGNDGIFDSEDETKETELTDKRKKERDAQTQFDECIIDKPEDMNGNKKKSSEKERKSTTGFEALTSGDIEKLPDFFKQLKDPDTLKLIALQFKLPEDFLVKLAPPIGNYILKYSPLFLPFDMEKLDKDKYKKYGMLIQDTIPIFQAIYDSMQTLSTQPSKEEQGEIMSFLEGVDDKHKETEEDTKEENKEESTEELPKEPPKEEMSSEKERLPSTGLDQICSEFGEKFGLTSEQVKESDFYNKTKTAPASLPTIEAPKPTIETPTQAIEMPKITDKEPPEIKEIDNEISEMKTDEKHLVKEEEKQPQEQISFPEEKTEEKPQEQQIPEEKPEIPIPEEKKEIPAGEPQISEIEEKFLEKHEPDPEETIHAEESQIIDRKKEFLEHIRSSEEGIVISVLPEELLPKKEPETKEGETPEKIPVSEEKPKTKRQRGRPKKRNWI